MSRPYIFFNFELLKADPKVLEDLTPGVVDRRGVFETMRISGGKIFAWPAHIKRLKKGLRFLKIKMPGGEKTMLDMSCEIIRQNKIKEGSLRISVWQDKGVNFTVVARPYSADKKKFKYGFTSMVSEAPYRSFGTLRIKSLEYSFFRKAFLSAQKKGCEEAIITNIKKEIVEGARTNIFCIKDRSLLTPPLSSGCLDGVARRMVMELSKQLNLKFQARRLTILDLLNADEVFCTNSVAGIMPLRSIGRSVIGSGKAGYFSLRLGALFTKVIQADLA